MFNYIPTYISTYIPVGIPIPSISSISSIFHHQPQQFWTCIVPRSSWQRKHLEEQGIAPQRVLEEARHLAEKQRKVKEHRDGGGTGETS